MRIRYFGIFLSATLLAAPAFAQSNSVRDVAKATCKSLVKTEIVDKKALEGIDPTPLCERLDHVFTPPSAPAKMLTGRSLSYSEDPKFYDALRKILKKQQGKNLEVWVTFDGTSKPTLSSLQKLGTENGYEESGLMTWISKSKSYGNQFCRATSAQSVVGELAKSGFNLFVGLIDKLITKWRAAAFYRPAKAYSIIAVHSSDPTDNEKLVALRFVPAAFVKPECGGFARTAPPEDLGTAKVMKQ